MLLREIVAVYSENYGKTVNTFCGQSRYGDVKVNVSIVIVF
jgi:hypothetical protein